ncbi:hypothetical protein GWI33_007220 [Rhynchophorus ferrugineus]|uniref:Uncharacterized protein n=1 Tax=Rhynchophorus ferrugineus TaxID=354439 RepID=A0A834IEP1_RHYFE|nr:hypothetical protein GWI33_007220 [Rhynchophorus ferrugineus]
MANADLKTKKIGEVQNLLLSGPDLTSYQELTNAQPDQQFEENEVPDEVNEEIDLENDHDIKDHFSEDPDGKTTGLINLNNVMQATHFPASIL